MLIGDAKTDRDTVDRRLYLHDSGLNGHVFITP